MTARYVPLKGWGDKGSRASGTMDIRKFKRRVGVAQARMSSLTARSIAVGGYAGGAIAASAGERKFVDNTVTLAVPLAFTWSAAQLLNGLALGTSASTRIGRKIVMKSLLLRYRWQLAATSVGGSPCRILVVYDKQANVAAPAITDILFSDTFTSANNLSNRDRFVTLSDHLTDPVSTGNDFAVSDVIYKNLNLESLFNAGTAGDITDITTGSVYLFACQASTITVAAPALVYMSRIRYTDV